jgi:lipid-binding SYLF domain-containing protein
MKTQIAAVLLAFSLAGTLAAQKQEAERLKESALVLDEIMKAPDDSIPGELLSRAECVAVIPSLKKGAFIVGGRFGRGAVSCRMGAKEAGPWGPPSMLTIGGGSVGFQLGGQSADIIMLVMNQRGMENLVKSKFTLGADAAAAAGPKGRSAAAATDVMMRAEILTYSRARGLFAGVSLDGASVRPDKDANQRLYGHAVEAKELLMKGGRVPAPAAPFIQALTKHAPRNVSAK